MNHTLPSVLIAPPKRILVCQLRQIGDVLLTTPSVAMLAQHFPDATIDFFTEKKCKPILKENPHIHKIWLIDRKKHTNLFKELRFYRQVTAKPYDLVIDFQRLPRSRWVVAMSGAKVRLAPEVPWYFRWLYTHTMHPRPAYAAAFKAQLLELLGIFWKNERPELTLTDKERVAATVLLNTLGRGTAPFLSVDVSHRQRTRRWGAQQYARLLDGILAVYPSIKFFLPYGPGEKEDIIAVQQYSNTPNAFLIPDEVISLRIMAACMEQASLHIGNCSAPRHMAVALGVPSFTILGATSPGWTFPSPEHTHISAGLPCQPCNKNTCPYGDTPCLTTFPASQVEPALLEHLRLYGKNISNTL